MSAAPDATVRPFATTTFPHSGSTSYLVPTLHLDDVAVFCGGNDFYAVVASSDGCRCGLRRSLEK